MALAEGLQNALWALGGVPQRTSQRQPVGGVPQPRPRRPGGPDAALRGALRHYGMTPTRNNPGVAHENGSIESPHGHLKKALEDALLLRGSRDFDDLDAYRRFVDEIVGRRNAHNRKRIELERPSACAAAEAAHRRLRGEDRHGHVERRLHSAPGVLHRAVAADRPSPARAPLRRPARLLPRLDAGDDAAARAAGLGQQGRSRRRLPARHPRAAQEADGAAQSGLPRPAVPASGLSPSLRGVARRGGRQAGVQGDGRAAGAGARSGLRGRAGAGHRRRNSMPGDCPTWRCCANASARSRHRCRSST